MKKAILAAALLAMLSTTVQARSGDQSADTETEAASSNPYRDDAQSIAGLISQVYAYPELLPNGALQLSPKLREEADQVDSSASLLSFAEKVLFLLADHHAITGSSFSDSYGVVPSFSDLWVERVDDRYVVTAVRKDTPADRSGVLRGDRLIRIDGTPIDQAIARWWMDLGIEPTEAQRSYSARVLAAGKRDRERNLGFVRADGTVYDLALPTLYMDRNTLPIVTAEREGEMLIVTINDALGDSATIAAFDKAMARAEPDQRIRIDLSNTPSGGNTVIARAILGWFVTGPTPYQRHSLPREQRETGIARQWLEEVLPREGKFHGGAVEVKVGRWTGSMGEGIAIGLDAIGACVWGDPMAGLLGAIYDYRLENSGLVIKLPTERMIHVDGTAREDFAPRSAPEQCE
jgi:carboxyl-terminal processing protease